MTTDDAYVGAQKVLITPDISGKINKIVVREGQQVKDGRRAVPDRPGAVPAGVAQAKAAATQPAPAYDNLVSNIKIYDQMADLMQQSVDLKQRDVDRKTTLAKSSFGSQLDLDNSSTALVTAQAAAAPRQQQMSSAKNQLLGNTDLPLEQFPPYSRPRRRSTRPSATSTTP